ncbi:MAG: hypothetical protein HRT71_15205 [Flavobacteriales bacterium]|nr:hypothetical protein [Flavobacteriales bacterium]
MNPILKNTLALIAGLIVGSIVNSVIVNSAPFIIPYPAGFDDSNMDSLIESMKLFEAKHFLVPFIAHALGTFVGAYLAYKIAASHKSKFAYTIGALFLLGGISMIIIVPVTPLWFTIVDLAGAYIPFAYLGIRLNEQSAESK